MAITLSTSRCVEDVARRFGCEVFRTKIGEINVASELLRRGCAVGGESNGGVMIPAIHPCRDSFAGMAVVLELLALEARTVSALRDEVPRYTVCRRKLEVRGDQAAGVLRHIRRDFAQEKLTLIDGVFVDFGDTWVHVRRSNTEPVLRITAEACDPARAAALVDEFSGRVETYLKQG